MKVAVFCSASNELSPLLYSEIEYLGEGLAEDGHEIIYGGCTAGCMGALARGVLRANGKLIGVVPEMDIAQGIIQKGLVQEILVPTLSARKEVMIRLADVFLVYPGGLGTLDEALEVLTLKSCGTLQKPVIFYNFLNVWLPFLECLDLLSQQNFIRQPLTELLQLMDKRESVRDYLTEISMEPC